jgi:16S rRNA (uracil1498-N3)-methyltransferase
MKQSNELYLPKLNEAISLKIFKTQTRGLQLAHCEETDKNIKIRFKT